MTQKKAVSSFTTISPLLTVQQVIAILGISRAQFDRLKNNGEIKVIKGTKLVRVEQAEVQRWIEAHRSEQ